MGSTLFSGGSDFNDPLRKSLPALSLPLEMDFKCDSDSLMRPY